MLCEQLLNLMIQASVATILSVFRVCDTKGELKNENNNLIKVIANYAYSMFTAVFNFSTDSLIGD
jgi:hypothetical protein